MKSSESIINLAKALLKFQSTVGNIKKDSVNPHFKNNFASLSGILNAVTPVLSDAGLVILQHPSGDGSVVNLETILIHAESGEFMSSEFTMRPSKLDPQGIGSCITYMRRYALGAILELNIDDDDGNEASRAKEPVKQNKVSSSYVVSQIATESEPMVLTKLSDFESMKFYINSAQTLEDLKEIGKEIAQLEKSDSQRIELANAYKERMEYIKDGEGM